jgi:hypothetical protein
MSKPAEIEYLELLDQIAQAEPLLTLVSKPLDRPPIYSIQYQHRPEQGSTTCFTVGLSSLPNLGWEDDAGPELAMRIRSLDRYWGFALAELACQGRGRQSFAPNVTIDFGAQMSTESEMTAFLLVDPTDFPRAPLHCTSRHIILLQALPLHADERKRILDVGPSWLLDQDIDFGNPSRPSAAKAG